MSNWIIHSEKRQWKNHEYEERVVEGEGVPGYIYPEGNSNHNTVAKDGRKEANPGVNSSDVKAMKDLLEDGFSVTDYHADKNGDPVFGIKTPSGDVHEFIGVPSKAEMKKWMSEQRSKKTETASSKTDDSKSSSSGSSKKGKSSSSKSSSSSGSSKKSKSSGSFKKSGSSKSSKSSKSDSDDKTSKETKKESSDPEAKMKEVLPSGFEIYESYEEDGNMVYLIDAPNGQRHKFVGVPSKEEMDEWAMNMKKEIKHGDYAVISKDSYLAHHGILGMKWGIRRYQNADGSLTDAGRKRYNAEVKRAEKKEAKEENKRIKAEDKAIRAERKKQLRLRRTLSDKDLLEAIGRLEKEKKYKDLLKEDLQRGDKEINDVLKASGKKAATMILTGAGLYAGNAALNRAFSASTAADYMFQKPSWKK